MLRLILLVFVSVANCKGDRDIYWRDYNKDIPEDAVPAGYGLFIGQGIYQGYLVPGTIYPKSGTFVSEYYGKAEKNKDFKIMCSRSPLRLKWERINVDHLPSNLMTRVVEGGYEGDMRWYIGRTFHQNEWRIGKVDFTGLKSLLVWNNDGSLHRVYDFDVLTYV